MSRVVYVGHVPFDMTEEQIEDIFRSAGPVEQTRLVFDRATGKSKGFAFVQYFEPESAASAVRNLDNYKTGSMHLKVNYSSGRFPGNNGGSSNSSNSKQKGDQQDETGVVPEIVNIVSGIPPPQKLELLKELKNMVTTQKDQAFQLLNQSPQLAYAIVQNMFELGMIDGNAAGSLIVAESELIEEPLGQNLSADQRVMYQQVMELTQEQLKVMPPEQRNAALAIRQQVESGAIVL